MRIAIALFDGVTALDAVGPYEVLSRLPGSEVLFAAVVAGPLRSDGGLGMIADVALDDIDTCDILVVPGGPGSRAVAHGGHPLVEWVRRVHHGTTWTTSVCTGSELLGAAGVLQGLEATTHWAAADRLVAFGADYRDRRIVAQGKVITAAGVSAGIDMALTLAGLVAGEDAAKAIQLGIEYDPQPPFDSGSVSKAARPTVDLVRAALATRRA